MKTIRNLTLIALTLLMMFASPTQALSQQGGTPVADNGFRPKVNGFNFKNYGNDTGYSNLTSADVRRLFGDQACASLQGNDCLLTPAGEQWMEKVNQNMDGGHCDGFAALSGLIYSNQFDPATLGGKNIYKLDINSSETLQREIAYWWATQTLRPTQDGYVYGTPNDVLDKLIAALNSKDAESFTVAVRMAGKGGHAVTPYAVEDMGNGIFHVLIYDNNYPGVERRIIVDRDANTWEYNLSTRPDIATSKWSGDANTQTFLLKTNSYRVPIQNCPFCENASGSVGRNGMEQAATRYNQIWVEGDSVHVLITDAQGKRFGLVNGKMVKEIPGVKFQTLDSKDLWEDEGDPIYYVPTGMQFTLSVDGGGLKKPTLASVTMIGPGYDLAVDEINLDPGQKDSITFSPDGKSISYKTDSTESPDIVLGYEAKGADYSFLVKGVDIEPGGTVNVTLDKDKGTLKLFATGNKQNGIYALIMGRIDDKGELYFGHDNIELAPKDSAILEYAKWNSNGATMPLGIDRNSDGSIDETIQLTDDDKVSAQPTPAPAATKPAATAAPTVAPTKPAATVAPAQPAATTAPSSAATPAPAGGGGLCGAIALAFLPVGMVLVLKRKKQ